MTHSLQRILHAVSRHLAAVSAVLTGAVGIAVADIDGSWDIVFAGKPVAAGTGGRPGTHSGEA